MFESFIIGALTSLVLSAFYFLFKKPSKKSHLYIQNIILIILAILCLIAFVVSLTVLTEFPILILPLLITVVPGVFFIIKKLLINQKELKNYAFEESENTISNVPEKEKSIISISLTKKKILVGVSAILIIALAIAIPLSIIGKEPKKQLITLKKANFETYFDVETSFSQINEVAQIKYSIEPHDDYANEAQPEQTIKVTLAVTFYKYSNTSSTSIKTEYIHINLQKSKDFKKTGNVTIDVPKNAKGYKIYVSYASGTIYA